MNMPERVMDQWVKVINSKLTPEEQKAFASELDRIAERYKELAEEAKRHADMYRRMIAEDK